VKGCGTAARLLHAAGLLHAARGGLLRAARLLHAAGLLHAARGVVG
jgi:hypothetical protein